jgi:hypothetical protein
MAKIAREKGAHMECPEFGLVQRELAEYERKALTRFRDDYDLKVEAENKVYAGEIHLIETRANVGFFSCAFGGEDGLYADCYYRNNLRISRMKCSMLLGANIWNWSWVVEPQRTMNIQR